jgi:hypothetical protein
MGFGLVDANGYLLSQGTAIEFPTIFNHEAIIGYAWNGRQVLLEKSKKHRRPAITDPSEYQGALYRISRSPQSPQHGYNIVQHAYAEVQAGGPWTLLDNCQDFVTRAYEGRNGSKSRNFAFGLALAVGLLWMVSA